MLVRGALVSCVMGQCSVLATVRELDVDGVWVRYGAVAAKLSYSAVELPSLGQLQHEAIDSDTDVEYVGTVQAPDVEYVATVVALDTQPAVPDVEYVGTIYATAQRG